ncbi:GntR family transcriptional regulator [Dictyobacter kobayashii]|uniref:GntR family transcriptional regulator n=1 Tax=Dictyobacter kobayashii TaxID=2014872 RepID=A0A402AZ37_9CHLR|nr:GntR family transcriptional regulator [Dictyobacter kobayashii]GCE24343.1 GntR family transcriptional regulator [Dictyobacter kobayashii]
MNIPLLLLNAESSVPPYEQIQLQLHALIASAQLAPGTALPSVRQLARDLGVAPNTIVRAYSELEREGWIVTIARRGVMVATNPPIAATEERKRRIEQAVTTLLEDVRLLNVSAQELHTELDRQLKQPGKTSS